MLQGIPLHSPAAPVAVLPVRGTHKVLHTSKPGKEASPAQRYAIFIFPSFFFLLLFCFVLFCCDPASKLLVITSEEKI